MTKSLLLKTKSLTIVVYSLRGSINNASSFVSDTIGTARKVCRVDSKRIYTREMVLHLVGYNGIQTRRFWFGYALEGKREK